MALVISSLCLWFKIVKHFIIVYIFQANELMYIYIYHSVTDSFDM